LDDGKKERQYRVIFPEKVATGFRPEFIKYKNLDHCSVHKKPEMTQSRRALRPVHPNVLAPV